MTMSNSRAALIAALAITVLALSHVVVEFVSDRPLLWFAVMFGFWGTVVIFARPLWRGLTKMQGE